MSRFHIPLKEPPIDPATNKFTERWQGFFENLETLLNGLTFDNITGDLPDHAVEHQQGGGDPIKLDDLATPDDNTDLDASVARHGLLPKLSGNGAHTLKGDGTWS